MNWETQIKDFKVFLKLEKSLSSHSIEAYTRDVGKFITFLEIRGYELSPSGIELEHLTAFLGWINEMGLSSRSQARII